MAGNQLGVTINGNVRPRVARFWVVLFLGLLGLHGYERPNFVDLDVIATNVNDILVHELLAASAHYIPRRDTNSRLNSWAGGTIFPGVHHLARFDVIENADRYSIAMNSDDGVAKVHVAGTVASALPSTSVFRSIQDASDFFEQGSLGYSDTKTDGKYDGLELQCCNWQVESLDIESIQSSYFEDTNRFPSGSVEFDCALLMRNIVHEWHGRPDLCCSADIGE